MAVWGADQPSSRTKIGNIGKSRLDVTRRRVNIMKWQERGEAPRGTHEG
jgi:hypothetical protein